MLGVFRLIFNGTSEPIKDTLNDVKDEALSTFRLYTRLIIIGVVLFGGVALLAGIALLKVIFGE